MKSFGSYNFLMILNESIKLVPRNGKLMAFITIFSLVLSSSSLLLFNYSLHSMIMDMTANMLKSVMPDPSSNNMPDPNPDQIYSLMRKDFSLMFAVQIPFLFAFSIIGFFTSISTILVSAMSYSAKTLSLNQLSSLIRTTWMNPLITILYVSALVNGYFIAVLTLAAPLLMYPNTASFWTAIVLITIALIFYLYLLVGWALAIVVSVVEESCYGLEALGKGAALIRGMKLHGFLINICLNGVVLIIFQGCNMMIGKKGFSNPTWYGSFMMIGKKGFSNPTWYGLFVVNIVSVLLVILMAMAYTVLYFQCKTQHREEIELHGSLQYSKLATTELVKEMP